MKGKTFLILLVAAGVLVALSYIRFGEEKNTSAVKMGGKLFSDLPVNAVATMTIADSKNKVTLVKGDKIWQVEERSGYPADFDALRNTLVTLSRLKIGRSFSGSPESLERLSLMAPLAADAPAGGMQITLKDPSGKILADVILGQPRKTHGGGGGGQYLKKADADTVFLVDGDFQFLKTEPAQWLKKEILDIKADAVASVTCFSDDDRTPLYTLSRPEKGETARMTPVPPGRTADTAKIDQVFDALAPLTLDDVKAETKMPPVEESGLSRLIYHLYDGRQISIFLDSDGKDSYVLRVTVDASTVETEAVDAPEPKKAEEEAVKPDAAAVPVLITAQELNDELRPWVFYVKKWQFDSFITRPLSLLEEVKKEGDGTS